MTTTMGFQILLLRHFLILEAKHFYIHIAKVEVSN